MTLLLSQRTARRQSGFSLLELMIALSIGLVAVAAVSAVLVSSSRIYRVSENRAQIQENARFSLSVLEQDVRQSGFMGCFNPVLYPKNLVNNVKDKAPWENNYQTWIGGFEAGASSWSPVLEAKIGTATIKPLIGNDVLVVRMPASASVALSDTLTPKTEPLQVTNTKGFVKGNLAIVSDCSSADLFVIGTLAADKKIVHAADANTTSALSKIYHEGEATVTPVTTVSYFIAAASDGVAGNNALWRQDGVSAPEEIVDGVENMQLEYGVDTAAVADGLTNRFVTADNVGTKIVTALKVSLLLRSPADNLALKKQVFNFNGKPDQSGTDKRLYTPFSTTIALRNRVL